MKESAQGSWDPRKGQQPFRPNPNGVEAAVDWCSKIHLGGLVDMMLAML